MILPYHHQLQGAFASAFRALQVNTCGLCDIRDLTQVADGMKFHTFMTAVAVRTSRPVVYEELAKETDISAPTAKQWLSVLRSSHIVALVQPYGNNVLKRTVKAPLLHMLDTSLCAYLLGWESPVTLERSMMAGQFFESWVFSEIYKSYVYEYFVPGTEFTWHGIHLARNSPGTEFTWHGTASHAVAQQVRMLLLIPVKVFTESVKKLLNKADEENISGNKTHNLLTIAYLFIFYY